MQLPNALLQQIFKMLNIWAWTDHQQLWQAASVAGSQAVWSVECQHLFTFYFNLFTFWTARKHSVSHNQHPMALHDEGRPTQAVQQHTSRRKSPNQHVTPVTIYMIWCSTSRTIQKIPINYGKY